MTWVSLLAGDLDCALVIQIIKRMALIYIEIYENICRFKMKSSKVMKLLVVLLLLGCILPTTSAKKEVINVKATAGGTYIINGSPPNVPFHAGLSLRAKVSLNEDGDYEGPAKIRSLFVLPDGTKITTNTRSSFIIPGYGDVGLARTAIIVVNDQEIPITQILEGDSKIWVTENAVYTLQNGMEITLNLKWNFKVEIEGIEAGH